jgi:hypothetical protein
MNQYYLSLLTQLSEELLYKDPKVQDVVVARTRRTGTIIGKVVGRCEVATSSGCFLCCDIDGVRLKTGEFGQWTIKDNDIKGICKYPYIYSYIVGRNGGALFI